MDTLKIYVWENFRTLQQYGMGKVIASASSVEAARRQAMKDFTAFYEDLYGADAIEMYAERIDDFNTEIMIREPRVIEGPTVFLEWGSA